METKEQKIERLKKAYLQIEQIKDEIFKRKMIVEDRINHLETMQKRIGIYENKNFPTPLSVSKTELEDLNGKWFKLIDESMKIRQQLKELENTVLTCDEIQELTPEEYKRQTEKVNE